jgi:hypothetical protein
MGWVISGILIFLYLATSEPALIIAAGLFAIAGDIGFHK